jgi:hypothetical protein
MDFGSNIYGQFRACTVDLMYLFEGGWCASVAKVFVRPLRSRFRLELDLLLERIRKSSRSSVLRNQFPRINFSGGLTSITQIASHEWPGVLLAYLIAIQMSQGRHLLYSRLEDDDKKYNQMVSKVTKKARFIKKREKVLKKNNLLSKTIGGLYRNGIATRMRRNRKSQVQTTMILHLIQMNPMKILPATVKTSSLLCQKRIETTGIIKRVVCWNI